jgi:hypothetical protein
MVFFFLLNPGDIVLLSTKIEVHLLMQGSTSIKFVGGPAVRVHKILSELFLSFVPKNTTWQAWQLYHMQILWLKLENAYAFI